MPRKHPFVTALSSSPAGPLGCASRTPEAYAGSVQVLSFLTGRRQSPPGSPRLGKRGRPVSIHLLAGKTTKQSAAHRGSQNSQEKCLSIIHSSVHPPLNLPHVSLCLFLSPVHLCHVSTICHISLAYLSKYTCAHIHIHVDGSMCLTFQRCEKYLRRRERKRERKQNVGVLVKAMFGLVRQKDGV